MVTTNSELMDEGADFFMKTARLAREEHWYRSVNQPLPRSIANKEQGLMQEIQMLKGKTGDKPTDKQLNALRAGLVRNYRLDFPPF